MILMKTVLTSEVMIVVRCMKTRELIDPGVRHHRADWHLWHLLETRNQTINQQQQLPDHHAPAVISYCNCVILFMIANSFVPIELSDVFLLIDECSFVLKFKSKQQRHVFHSEGVRKGDWHMNNIWVFDSRECLNFLKTWDSWWSKTGVWSHYWCRNSIRSGFIVTRLFKLLINIQIHHQLIILEHSDQQWEECSDISSHCSCHPSLHYILLQIWIIKASLSFISVQTIQEEQQECWYMKSAFQDHLKNLIIIKIQVSVPGSEFKIGVIEPSRIIKRKYKGR